MKVTCGADIIEINRVKECLESMEEKFATRVFTKDEIQHYAARFAAKEAVFKAISFCLKDKYSICWKDIEVINDAQGRPQVNLSVENLKQIDSIDLSLSHCKEYATANVVVVWR